MDYKIIILVISLSIFFTIENFFPFYKNRIIKKRVIYSIQNIILAIFNSFLVIIGFASLFLIIYKIIDNYSIGILNLFQIPPVIKILFGFLLIDLWIYYWHFINHNSKFLWKFHRAHHSDIEMDSTTAIRFHTGEILMSSLLKIPVFLIIGINPEIIIIHEIILNVSTIFHHSNINMPESIDRILRIIIVTPNMHRVHHSQIMQETNSNYTSIFSFWDRLFRTFRMNSNISSIKLGLKEFTAERWQNLWGVIITPFVKVK